MSFNRKFKPETIARHKAERIVNTHNRRCQLLADTADAAVRDKAGPESIFHELLAERLAELQTHPRPN